MLGLSLGYPRFRAWGVRVGVLECWRVGGRRLLGVCCVVLCYGVFSRVRIGGLRVGWYWRFGDWH